MTNRLDAGLEKLRSRVGALDVYLDKRVISILFLGFSSGLPLMLVLRTLSAWLQEEGVDKDTIGLFAFTFAPYTFKFAWAPFMDRLPLPVLTRLFGRRRGWLLLTQVCLIGAIFGLGQTSPGQDLFMTAVMALLVSFCSASQDVVIDAYRIEILPQHQLGAGAANVVTGYRIGMWVAGAGALWLADLAGWSIAYAAMALLILVGVAAVLLNPEPAAVDWERAAEPPLQLTDHRQLASLMLLAVLLGAFIGLLL
ncbi:MAG: MFS transporter, partial [Nitrospirota bacterium]|nr:MFS transporter [Nitrospirota bacterium]